MNPSKPRLGFVWSAIIIALIGGGCIGGSSQKAVYYVLRPIQHSSPIQLPGSGMGLGIGPIQLPDYLDRPQIVRRKEPNVLLISEFHRWGDSLAAQISGLLVQNLSVLLNTSNVNAYPWEIPFSPDYQLYINFRRIDGDPSGAVVVESVWSLVETREKTLLFTRQTRLQESAGADGYKGYVMAINRALEHLAAEIAEAIGKYISGIR